MTPDDLKGCRDEGHARGTGVPQPWKVPLKVGRFNSGMIQSPRVLLAVCITMRSGLCISLIRLVGILH